MECDDDENADSHDERLARLPNRGGLRGGHRTDRSFTQYWCPAGAGLKSLVGGELKGLTKQLMQSREEALARLMEAATSRGANAVIAMRFDANEVSAGYQEIVAYGTAVRVTKNA